MSSNFGSSAGLGLLSIWEDIIYKGGFIILKNIDGFRNDLITEVRKEKISSITIFKK